MYLNLKGGCFKLQVLYWHRTVIPFQDNQVPIKGPRLSHEDLYSIHFKLEIKQHLVIAYVINLEVASCSPK